MPLPSFRRSRSIGAMPAFALAAAGALIISSCISDGSNQTGGKYLTQNGIILTNPLYHVKLKDFPVDTSWTTDLEPSHLGDSVMLAGARGNFSADARIAYDFVDTNFVDSLRDSTKALKLGLGFFRFSLGLDSLKTIVRGVDSMLFEVTSWSLADTGWASRGDTLSRFNLRFMQRQDTTAILPDSLVRRDTIKVMLDSAYARDSLQSFPLPNLRARLIANTKAPKWAVYLQLHALAPGALLRLGGGGTGLFEPTLIFGKNTLTTLTATADHQRLYPAVISNVVGVTSRIRYAGPPGLLLAGKNRGMHLVLDRKEFMDSVSHQLHLQGIPFEDNPSGNFDQSFFVPFGSITLPLDSAVAEPGGAFPLEFLMVSDIDSIIPGLPSGAYPRAEARLEGDKVQIFKIADSYDYSVAVDSVSVEYHRDPRDTSLRMAILRSYRDTTAAASRDTVVLAPGQSRELSKTYSVTQTFVYYLAARDTALEVAYYVNAHAGLEPNGFRDPTTGVTMDSLKARLPHSVRPRLDSALTLRSTRGLQRLLNRTQIGETLFADFFIEPVNPPAIDTVINRRPTFPIMAEIAPKAKGPGGKQTVDVDLYLFPVKER